MAKRGHNYRENNQNNSELKAEMNSWELKPSNEKETEINAFKSELETIKEEIINCEL